MNKSTYRLLMTIAIGGTLLWLGYALYEHFAARFPGDQAYFAANNLFKDGYYERAEKEYRKSFEENPQHMSALRGLANSLVQLKRYDEALTVTAMAIEREPEFGGHYAIRGIIHDRTGKYNQAIEDYEKALQLDPEIAEGMHWLDRLLHNVQETPSNIATRLKYLREQMTLPPEKRLLVMPEKDATQRPYEK